MEKRVNLLPFITVDGIPTFADSELKYLFRLIEEAGYVEDAFCDGSIQTPEDFVNACKSDGIRTWVVTYNGEIRMLAWLDNFKHASAYGHFVATKNDGTTKQCKEILRIAKETIRQLLNMKDQDGNYIFAVILGLIPANNDRAAKFSKAFGMVRVGIIPQAIYNYYNQTYEDGIISYITRKEERP